MKKNKILIVILIIGLLMAFGLVLTACNQNPNCSNGKCGMNPGGGSPYRCDNPSCGVMNGTAKKCDC